MGTGDPPFTPDGRYIVVRERLWRAANPHLEPSIRGKLVQELMDARRAVKKALRQGDADELVQARGKVQSAKEQLGERGRIWWTDGAPDYNRRLIKNTPYADWWKARSGQGLAQTH